MTEETKVKQSFRHIIKNNFWMLRFVFKYAPSLVIEKLIRIPILVLSAYINVNLARWIFKNIENGAELKPIIFLIISISSFFIFSNLIIAFFSIVFVPQKTIILSSRIREDVIKKISRINQIEFQNSKFFDSYSLGLNEIDHRATQVLDTISSLFESYLTFFVVTGVAAAINGRFALFGFTAVMIEYGFGIIRMKYNYRQDIESTPYVRLRGYINRITYQPEFTSDLKIYPNFVQLLISTYRRATIRVKAIILNYSWKILTIDQIQQVSSIIFRHLLPWITITILLTNGKITIPEATVLVASALTIPNALSSCINSTSSFYRHSLYIENLLKIFEREEIIETNRGENLNPLSPINICVEHVSFSYTNGGVKAVNNCSMKINHGDKIAIVGYNGAGKSTLVKLLVRLYDADEGRILINDRDIKEYNVKSIRSRIALLSQSFKLYNFTVAENILMRPVLSDEDLELVYNALKKVGLYNKIMSWPNGINTFITREFDESGEYLSGGEEQKLALARIYAGNYDCIIMDESTSALDPISEDEIISTIFEIFKDKTIVIISHRLVSVKFVDRVSFLSNGLLYDSGTHEELMHRCCEYNYFYSTQAEKYKK